MTCQAPETVCLSESSSSSFRKKSSSDDHSNMEDFSSPYEVDRRKGVRQYSSRRSHDEILTLIVSLQVIQEPILT